METKIFLRIHFGIQIYLVLIGEYLNRMATKPLMSYFINLSKYEICIIQLEYFLSHLKIVNDVTKKILRRNLIQRRQCCVGE